MNLVELQQRWQQAILQDAPLQVVDTIVSPPHDSAEVRVQIYTEGYIARLLEVLQTIFPALYAIWGEENFCTVGEAYLRANPSYCFMVGQIGKDFAKFLKQTSLSFASHPVYRDIAALEWAICAAVEQADAIALQIAQLKMISEDQWGQLKFALHSSFALLEFHTNAVAYYQAYAQKHSFPTVEITAPSYIKIWRRQQQVFYLTIDEPEYVFLHSVQKNQSFAVICEKLCQLLPEAQVVNFAIQCLLNNVEAEIFIGASI